ncbi:hypothetical protein AKJ38_03295 [candidate division MSBL1 archaeon SCGC-AAA259I14]|uniref:Ni/Fe hydrogenase subunit alpha n=1 Tax=candidate division MSBL1 archaeon SCGC-AAA259I14 TaxID=1698268 RepID=A0A133UQG9_9EURY|nr:hypothetical protein AKJ38_03295 [candidate division MSBL1 archaeon SCGC-AAA259I14]
MSEEVNLVERIEGHLSLDIDLERRDGRKIRLEIREGPRLFEGFLKGRDYNEIPFFASRICGFCPIVHNLSAIKALENAMNVSVNEQTLDFRRALNCMAKSVFILPSIVEKEHFLSSSHTVSVLLS